MTGAAQMLTVRVPLAARKQRGGRKLVLTPASATNRGSSAADTTLVKALALAFRWQRLAPGAKSSAADTRPPIALSATAMLSPRVVSSASAPAPVGSIAPMDDPSSLPGRQGGRWRIGKLPD